MLLDRCVEKWDDGSRDGSSSSSWFIFSVVEMVAFTALAIVFQVYTGPGLKGVFTDVRMVAVTVSTFLAAIRPVMAITKPFLARFRMLEAALCAIYYGFPI